MTRAVQSGPTSPASGLGREQIREFFQLGFTVMRSVFCPEELGRMRAAFSRLRQTARTLGGSGEFRGASFVVERRAGSGPKAHIQRVVWCGGAEPLLDRLGRDPRLVGPAARLLGSRRVVQLINQAHYKLPGDGVEFPWHQDSSHRRFGKGEWLDVNGRGSYVQTVTAIDDADESNGGLGFIPGSCSFGHITLPDDSRGCLPAWRVDPARAVVPRLRAGDVVLFGPYTIHGSAPNTSDRPRRAFINGFACPGANRRVYPGAGTGRPLVADPAC